MNKALLVSALASHAIKNYISPKEEPEMAALSKEGVKGIAESLGWSLDEIELGDMADFAEIARADLVAENERLKALSVTNIMVDFVPGDGSGLEVYAKSVDEVVNLLSELGEKVEDLESVRAQLTATRTALAAAEARETKLLRLIEKLPCESESLLWEVINEKRDALVQPRDDSALREMIAGVYDECAKACEDDAKGWTDYSCEMAARDCADAIRALAEKAKGECK